MAKVPLAEKIVVGLFLFIIVFLIADVTALRVSTEAATVISCSHSPSGVDYGYSTSGDFVLTSHSAKWIVVARADSGRVVSAETTGDEWADLSRGDAVVVSTHRGCFSGWFSHVTISK